jgi:putative transposase
MDNYRRNGHAIHDIKYHVIWVKKYRNKVLKGTVAIRIRELIRQKCEAKGIIILRGSLEKKHIHYIYYCHVPEAWRQVKFYSI